MIDDGSSGGGSPTNSHDTSATEPHDTTSQSPFSTPTPTYPPNTSFFLAKKRRPLESSYATTAVGHAVSSTNDTPAKTQTAARKGRPLHMIWSVFTEKANAHLASEGSRAPCKHCETEVVHHNKTACVERHLRRCAPFLSQMHALSEHDRPDWFNSVRSKKRPHSNTSLVFSIKNTPHSALGGMTVMPAGSRIPTSDASVTSQVYPTLMHAAATASTIKLNVGGTIFETSKATLLQHELSFFHDMLLTSPTRPDGAYFLDLDPKAFAHVMDFLRYGELCVEGLNSWERRKLAKTMGFLKLHTTAQHAWNPFAESAFAASSAAAE